MRSKAGVKIQESETKHDKNSCTVLALKSVSGWEEQKCYELLKSMGRKDRKGFDVCKYFGTKIKLDNITLTSVNGLTLKPVSKIDYYDYYRTEDFKPLTLDRFALLHPKGVFYVCVRRHALAIVNGVIVDNVVENGGRRVINCVWKVTGSKPKIDKLKENVVCTKNYKKVKEGNVVEYIGDKTIQTNTGVILVKKGDKFTITSNYGVSHYGDYIDNKQVSQVGKLVNFMIRNDKQYCKFSISRSDFEIVKVGLAS
jgi:hypothetical protein